MATDALRGAGLILLGYAMGSVPTGVILTRRLGKNIRRLGSGNIGATNVARTAGWRLGLVTLAGDVLKGAVPVAIAMAVQAGSAITAATGAAAFSGHVFPLTLRFAGGKGVATALGALALLCPLTTPILLVVFATALAATRFVSLASVTAAAAAPAAVALLGYPTPMLLAASFMTGVIVIRHRPNLRRILLGTEPVLRKRQAPPCQ